jgi:hypothetical protein
MWSDAVLYVSLWNKEAPSPTMQLFSHDDGATVLMIESPRCTVFMMRYDGANPLESKRMKSSVHSPR